MQSYLVHAMEGRARLRHPLFADEQQRRKALTVLEKESTVLEVRPGRASLLLLLTSDANISALCSRLEQAMPELKAAVITEERASRCHKPLSELFSMAAPVFSGVRPRKLELRTMLGVGGLCLALGLFGSGRSHVAAGGLFTLLAVRHIWTRRKLL